ncbi:MAG: GrpB family protein [Gammaproteobacteria bacterium]|nr:GrpB family protein [Gammaproteobacteria bacterium]
MSLGLKHGENRLCLYSDDWPNQFRSEANRIIDVCGSFFLAIEHVGSTAVPGLTAKPIVDILVGVSDLGIAEQMVPGMESIGYDYPGNIGIPGDRIFGRDPGFRLFLVHVVEHDSQRWTDYLHFRDALRANKLLSEEYAKLKTEISEKHPEGRGIYAELKSDYISRVLMQQR